MKEIKIFISQPMRNKTNEEIINEREKIKHNLESIMIDTKITILDSFFENAPHEAKPLWFLGKSFEILSTADLAVFAEGWEEARGCRLEHEATIAYGINRIYITK